MQRSGKKNPPEEQSTRSWQHLPNTNINKEEQWSQVETNQQSSFQLYSKLQSIGGWEMVLTGIWLNIVQSAWLVSYLSWNVFVHFSMYLVNHPAQMHTARRHFDSSGVKSFHWRPCFVPWLSSDCPADGRTWVPFRDRCYHFVHGEEDKLKSYTFERAKTLCQGFGTWGIFLSHILSRQKKNDKWAVFLMYVWFCCCRFSRAFEHPERWGEWLCH